MITKEEIKSIATILIAAVIFIEDRYAKQDQSINNQITESTFPLNTP
nr:MAG: hypothetical protein [Caudoviricetes sp.]